MRKTTKFLVAVVVLFISACSNLFAQVETELKLTSGYHDPKSQGGEFTAYLSGNATVQNYIISQYNSDALVKSGSQTGFETFCVEINESFKSGTEYNTTMAQNILPGGAAVTIGTAYLYSQFAQGTLQGYTYSTTSPAPGKTNSREYTSDELQDAIWYLQGEITSQGDSYTTANGLLYEFGGNYFNPTNDPFVKLVENMFGTNAFASDANDNYGVQVLELTLNGQPAQDQLVYCPVPEPGNFAAAAMLMVPLGWSIVRLIRKKNPTPRFAAIPATEPEKQKLQSRAYSSDFHTPSKKLIY